MIFIKTLSRALLFDGVLILLAMRSPCHRAHKCVLDRGRIPCVDDSMSRFSNLFRKYNMKTFLRLSELQCVPVNTQKYMLINISYSGDKLNH